VSVTRAYGCMPDPVHDRSADLAICAYPHAVGDPRTSVVEHVHRIQDQGHYQTCLGYGTDACIESVVRRDVDPLAIWRDARRRYNQRGMGGTYPLGAVASVVERGVQADRYGVPEDYVDWSRINLAAELDADDHRVPEWARYRIATGVHDGDTKLAGIAGALYESDTVLFCSLVGQPFGGYTAGVLDDLGQAGGHAMRVFGVCWSDEVAEMLRPLIGDAHADRMRVDMGRIPRQRVWLIQNSYGRTWGYGGIALVSDAVIASPYVTDVHVFRWKGIT
jgi:hypothetical protein